MLKLVEKTTLKHTRLWKYKSFNFGMTILDKRKIKISSASDLNDIYEAFPKILYTEEELISELKHENFRRQFFPLHNTRNFKSTEENIPDSIPEVERQLDNFIAKKIKSFASKKGVYSLSRDPLDLMMWAHYGDSWKGLCFGFVFTDFPYNPTLIEVDYQDQRPILKLDQLLNITNNQEVFTQLVSTKSLHWKDEKEFRFLFNLDKLTPDCKGLYFLSIKPKNIDSITFGPRISKNNLEKLTQTLKNPDFSHIRLCGIGFDKSGEYRVHRFPVDFK